MNLFARTVPPASAFPERKAGRLLHYPFRGLLSVHSRYGLHAHRVAIATLFTEGFSGFVTSTAAPIVTGRNEPAPGRDFHPLWTSAFPRRTLALRLSALGGVSAYNNVVFAGDQYLTNGFRSGFTSTGMFSFGKSGVTFTLNDTAAVSTGVWNWFGITYLSGSASLYRNGALAATVSGTYIVGTTNMGLDAGTGGVDFY